MWTPKYNISTSKAQDFLISQTHMIFPKESKSFEKLSCFPRDPRLLLWWILARSCLGEVVLTFSSSSSSSLSSVSTELRMSSFMDRFLSTSALLVLMNFIACSSLRHWDLIFQNMKLKEKLKITGLEEMKGPGAPPGEPGSPRKSSAPLSSSKTITPSI